MDRSNPIVADALYIAFDALQTAAAELAIVSAMASSAGMRTDARVLAAAVEAEILALRATVARRA
jgi:hypothetical protein